MKSIFSGKDMDFGQHRKTTKDTHISRYFVFTEIELFSLIFCVILDVIEYAAAVLMMPVVGDVFDVVGILVCLVIFRWIGLVSLVELVPGADVLPIFIITWLMWYLLKKQKIATHKL
jgi:hypothetical protein